MRLQFEERVALLAVALAPERAEGLLEGLVRRGAAQQLAHAAREWSSSTRQARLELALGARPGPEARVRALIEEVTERLQAEVHRALPAYLQSLFPAGFQAAAQPAPAALRALARRLAHEASR